MFEWVCIDLLELCPEKKIWKNPRLVLINYAQTLHDELQESSLDYNGTVKHSNNHDLITMDRNLSHRDENAS